MSTLFQPCSPCCGFDCDNPPDVLYLKTRMYNVCNSPNVGGVVASSPFSDFINNCYYCFDNKEFVLNKTGTNLWKGTYQWCSDTTHTNYNIYFSILPNSSARYHLQFGDSLTAGNSISFIDYWGPIDGYAGGRDCFIRNCRCIQFIGNFNGVDGSSSVGCDTNLYLGSVQGTFSIPGNFLAIISDIPLQDNYFCPVSPCEPMSQPVTQNQSDSDIYIANPGGVNGPENIIFYVRIAQTVSDTLCIPTVLKGYLNPLINSGNLIIGGNYNFQATNGLIAQASSPQSCRCNVFARLTINRTDIDCHNTPTLPCLCSFQVQLYEDNFIINGGIAFEFGGRGNRWIGYSDDCICNLPDGDKTVELLEYNSSGIATGNVTNVVFTKDSTGYQQVFGSIDLSNTLYLYTVNSFPSVAGSTPPYIDNCYNSVGTLTLTNNGVWSGSITTTGEQILLEYLTDCPGWKITTPYDQYTFTDIDVLFINDGTNRYGIGFYTLHPLLIYFFILKPNGSKVQYAISDRPPPDSDHVVSPCASGDGLLPKVLNVHTSLVAGTMPSDFVGFSDYTLTGDCGIRSAQCLFCSGSNFSSGFSNQFGINYNFWNINFNPFLNPYDTTANVILGCPVRCGLTDSSVNVQLFFGTNNITGSAGGTIGVGAAGLCNDCPTGPFMNQASTQCSDMCNADFSLFNVDTTPITILKPVLYIVRYYTHCFLQRKGNSSCPHPFSVPFSDYYIYPVLVKVEITE